MLKTNTQRNSNSKNHINHFGDGIFLFIWCFSVTTNFEDSFTNFNAARKADNVYSGQGRNADEKATVVTGGWWL